MGPLGFVNWRVVSARFCLLMWIAAAVLAWIILMHVARSPAGAAHHMVMRGIAHRAGAG